MELDRKGRIWAEIDLDALLFNFAQAGKLNPGAKRAAVIKADAYGHGSVQCAKALVEEGGADFLAVAAPEEALRLRKNGLTAPILLLGIAPECYVAELSENNISLACPTPEAGEMFSRLATKPLKIHAVLDTGMSRLGFQTLNGVAQAGDAVIALSTMKNLILEGVFTHFCVADTLTEDEYTAMQLKLFGDTVAYIRGKGVNIPIAHCANSAAIIRFPEAKFDMVREGIMLYGVDPDSTMHGMCELRPVMSLRARVMQVKTIEAGETLGYGRTWTAPRQTKIATVGIGYADGLPRKNSGKIEMLVNGRRVKQVGRICMDITMLDVTGLDVKFGDIVTVFGSDGDRFISVDEQCANVPTIAHEVLCNVARRVTRIYYKNGKAIAREEML